jgi:hypothetical protein
LLWVIFFFPCDVAYRMHLDVVKQVPISGGDSNSLAEAWKKLCKQRTDVCY